MRHSRSEGCARWRWGLLALGAGVLPAGAQSGPVAAASGLAELSWRVFIRAVLQP